MAGFRLMTLGPSPALRAHRQRLARRDLTAEAWNEVGRALSQAIAEVSLTVEKSSGNS